MKDDRLSRAFRIRDPRAGRAIADHRLRDMLALFANAPRTIGDAAARSGIELKRLHHHVQTLRAAGLLETVGEVRRPGRPMKLYRAVADSFFVGDELLPQPFMQSLADELAQSMLAHGFSSGRGVLFTIAPNGDTSSERIDPEEAPARVISLYFRARVPPADLPALKAALREVVERFDQPHRRDAKPYILHAAAAPRLSGQ